MEAAASTRHSLGDILLDRGLISRDDLESALAEEKATDRRLADILVRRGLVSGHDITDALTAQMSQFSGEDGAAAPPALTVVEAEPTDHPTTDVGVGLDSPAEVVHDESEPDEASSDADLSAPAPEVDDPETEPTAEVDVLHAEPAAADDSLDEAEVAERAGAQLTKAPEVIRETDERRATAESRLTMLGGLMESLDGIRTELEDQGMITPPLAYELEATQDRVRTRRQDLSEEIAYLERKREAVDRTSGELELLRGEIGGKLGDLSSLQSTAEMWNSRVADLEAEVNGLVERMDSLSRELARLVDDGERVPETDVAVEIPAPDSPQAEAAEDLAWPGQSPATHLLFVPTDDGYELVEQGGPVPAVGDSIAVGDAMWVVTRIAPSPLPLDDRPCVFFAAG